jgi:hypothetical protein
LDPVRRGGFILTGTSYFDPDWTIRVIETDASGQVLWNATLDINMGTPYGGFVCRDGGIVFAGSTGDTSSHDLTLARLDTNGQLLWNYTYNLGDSERVYSVVEGLSGGYAITGSTTSSGMDAGDAFLALTDSSGGLLLSLGYNSQWQDAGYSVAPCQDGSYIIAGGTGNDAWLVRLMEPELQPPTWIAPPTNQLIDYNAPFTYTLNATDPIGLDIWWLQDPRYFNISQQGVITNTIIPAIGTYPITVYVNDTWGFTQQGTFTITVLVSISTIIALQPLIAVILIEIILLLIACHRLRRSNPTP